MKIIEDFCFRNWAANERCFPLKYFQPQTEQEIVSIVKEAAFQKKKIRVVGAGHSWSSLACTDGYMVNLDNYCRIIYINKEKRQIRVQAGIRLKRLNKVLDENGLALVNLGSISEQSLAGVTATGTHGTGIRFQILSTAIIGMRVVNADGEIIEIKEDNPLLDAYRLSLGVLGIITEITLQCTEAFSLREDSVPMLFETALEKLPQLLQENDHLKFWWFPHVRHLMVYRYNRAERRTGEEERERNIMLKWTEDVLLSRYFFAFLLRAGNVFPSWIPFINNFIGKIQLKKIKRVGKSNKIFNVPMPPKHRESEYAIPVERTAEALHALRGAIEKHRLKINFVVEVRFVKGDPIWLSPAYGRDSCYIGGYLYGDKRWASYLALFEKLMVQFDGKPHWGKEFTPALHDFEKMYERLGDFRKLKNEADSANLFGNELTGKIQQ
ncbi:MAG TPA: D-arabinono-1,4-lactone oxidase [Chitinophagales bacterium]|nr:D-arabinono-1,4-lactone oxidase [Chitinophagales bacterium]